MSEKVGTFSFNKPQGSYMKKNYFKIAEGQKQLFRILPPFGDGVKNGVIAQYWSVFWLKNSEGKSSPVASIQRKKGSNIIVHDPLVEKLNQMNTTLEYMKKNGENPASIKQFADKIMSLSPDNNYHLNAMTPTGEIGCLKLRYTAYQALWKRINELHKDYGIDAINPGPTNGVFFEFERFKDEKGKTIYKVDVASKVTRDPITNKMSVEYIMAPIGDIELARMEVEAFDLGSMYKVYTPEEMASLATLDPKMVDRICSRPTTVTEPTEGDEEVGTSFNVGYKEFGNDNGFKPPTEYPQERTGSPLPRQPNSNTFTPGSSSLIEQHKKLLF